MKLNFHDLAFEYIIVKRASREKSGSNLFVVTRVTLDTRSQLTVQSTGSRSSLCLSPRFHRKAILSATSSVGILFYSYIASEPPPHTHTTVRLILKVNRASCLFSKKKKKTIMKNYPVETRVPIVDVIKPNVERRQSLTRASYMRNTTRTRVYDALWCADNG